MKGTLLVKRLYSLGDYKNITFDDKIEDIPEHILLSAGAMQTLSQLQMVRVELSYRTYLLMNEVLKDEGGLQEQIESMLVTIDESVKQLKEFIGEQ